MKRRKTLFAADGGVRGCAAAIQPSAANKKTSESRLISVLLDAGEWMGQGMTLPHTTQKYSLVANWMIRGELKVVICPNVPLVLSTVGLLQFA